MKRDTEIVRLREELRIKTNRVADLAAELDEATRRADLYEAKAMKLGGVIEMANRAAASAAMGAAKRAWDEMAGHIEKLEAQRNTLRAMVIRKRKRKGTRRTKHVPPEPPPKIGTFVGYTTTIDTDSVTGSLLSARRSEAVAMADWANQPITVLACYKVV